MQAETIDLFWVEDSGGEHSCHINGKDLSFKDSLIGTLHLRNDNWRVFLKDGTDITPEDGCMTYARARGLMEAYYRKHHSTTPKQVEATVNVVNRLTPRTAQPGKI